MTVLEGKVAVVTGASSGFGQAIAENLGSVGAHVYLCGRSLAPMQATKAAIEQAGGRADVSAFDIRNAGELQRFVADAAGHHGRLDIMVNNAGLGDPSTSLADGNPDDWREMLEVNVLALAVGCQAAIRAMRKTGSEGHIVNISSVAALRRESGMYGATKHAVNCLNSTLRQELESDTIRVTSIMPGAFATNFSRNLDRAVMEGLAASIGINELDFDSEGRLPRATMDAMQQKMKPFMGDAAQVAEAVRYVVTQPIELNIEEIVIRPQKSLETLFRTFFAASK